MSGLRSSVPAAMLMASLAATGASAATFIVTSLADSGSGSLRATVAAAASGDSINITATGTLTLTSGEIPVTKALTIAGPGATSLTISGNATSRIFKVSATTAGAEDAPLSLSGVTLASGYASGTCPVPATGSGGAIAATESLSLSDVVISNSHAARNGGALAWALRRNGQSLTLSNVRVSGNSAGCASATAGGIGGGIFAGYDSSVSSAATGTVTLLNTRFLGNSAQRHGGGIALTGPVSATISGARLSGNTAVTGYGGALYLAPPSVSTVTPPAATVSNSELSSNLAALAGGAIAAANLAAAQQGSGSRSALVLTNSTVSGNVVQSAAGDGAAASLAGNVALTLNSCTVANNDLASNPTGAAIVRGLCTVTTEPIVALNSTIVALTNGATSGYSDLSDGGVTFASAWSTNQSLIQQASVTLSGAGNITAVDPQLMALGWNGGSTRSHALNANSPALNAGSNPLGLSTDQRGAARTFGGVADIGAYEATVSASTTAGCSFDLDGDGVLAASTDGLLLARIMLGYSGSAVVAGAVNSAGTRPTWAAIRTYLNANCGFTLP